jgi:hypothetical protein
MRLSIEILLAELEVRADESGQAVYERYCGIVCTS